MQSRIIALVGMIFLVLLILASPSVPLRAVVTQSAATPGASALTVTSVDVLPLPDTGNAYLSPDGKHIAWTQGSDICIYSAAGEKEACNVASAGVSAASIRWSPDSQRIAFTEDFYRYLRNSDLWVMDLSGKLTDLTDDHLLKFELKPPADPKAVPNIDAVPTWSPDGKRLFFIRYLDIYKDRQAAVYSIDPNGGDPKLEGKLASTGIATYALSLSPDGKTIAYNIGHTNRQSPDNGLWIAGLDGQNAKQLLNVSASEDPKRPQAVVPSDIEFSPDGRYVVILDSLVAGAYAHIDSPCRVASTDGSGNMPIDADNQAQWAAWSPTVSSLAYLRRDPKNPENSGLYVVAKPGDHGQQVYKGIFASAGQSWRNLDWAANNTILTVQFGDKRQFVLLHLGAQ